MMVTIGIASVASWAACAAGCDVVTITSTGSCTRSAAAAAKPLSCLPALRHSKLSSLSVWPSSRSPRINDPNSLDSPAYGMSQGHQAISPIRGI